MASDLSARDLEFIMLVAEHRVLSTGQLVRLCGRNARCIRRAVAGLENAGLVAATEGGVGLGRDRGRPEKVLSLTPVAVELLKAQGHLDATTPGDQVTAVSDSHTKHQLLLNWFRVFLVEMERGRPQFDIRFLSGKSPFTPRRPDGRELIYEEASPNEPGRKMTAFIPDGVFWITHRERKMTLLFFLEVDLGTEPTEGNRSVILQKILNYQSYFRTRRYARYEQMTKAKLKGFRVLFLAHATPRLAALCRIVRQTPPSDFIWLTDQGRMFAQGLQAPIWARGGRIDSPFESILGRGMPAAGGA